MGFPQVDNGPMDLLSSWRRRPRPAVATLALAALTAVPAPPALAAPERSGPEALAAARAEAARLDGLIQAAHRHQAELERSELALQTARAEYAGDVRDLYARGPLAPLELLLAAGDIHELAVAAGVAGGVLDRDGRALASVGLADRTAMLATARAEVRAQVRAEQARQEAARTAMVAAASARARALGFAALADTPAPNATAAVAVRAALGQVGKP